MLKYNEIMDVNLVKKFAKFCQKKMGIKKLPKITLTEKRDKITTTAGYIRGKEIIVFTKGRHIVDVCRSLAHELKHHKQLEDEEFGLHDKIQDVGGKHEDDANAVAGQMIKQFAYSGNMNIYESRKILQEGRVDDAKRKYPSLSSKLVDYVSSKDPSGNNKYLNWILRQLRQKLLITPQADLNAIIDEILVKVKGYNDLLPYYLPKNLDPNETPERIYKNPKDINNFQSIEELDLTNQMILPHKLEKEKNDESIKGATILYDGDDYIVVMINSSKDACYFGRGTRWCVNDTRMINEYRKKYFIFFIVNKDLDVEQRYSNIALLIGKDPNTDQYIQLFSGDDIPLKIDELKDIDPRLIDMVRLVEMWKENRFEKTSQSIKNSNQELFALTEYVQDEDLKHYKQNPSDGMFSFTYNNGKEEQKYYIGKLEQLEKPVKEYYIGQHKKNPKLLYKHPEKFPYYVNYKKLTNKVYDYIGLDNIFINPAKIKPFYAAPPMKLKTDNLVDNDGDLKRLKQLDLSMTEADKLEKQYKTNLNFQNRHIERYNKTLEEIKNKLGVLKIRAEQVKNDTTKYNDIQFKISEYTRAIEHDEIAKADFVLNKERLEDTIKKNKKQFNDLSDEYTEIINTLEQSYDNKDNYEYSKDQIKDIKEKIHRDVMSNPFSWVEKLNLTPNQTLELIDTDKLGDSLFEQFIKNVKSFGDYKLSGTIISNNTEYYIFTNETTRHINRK